MPEQNWDRHVRGAIKIATDVQFLVDCIMDGKVRSSPETTKFLIGLISGLCLGANIDHGATPEQQETHRNVLFRAIDRLVDLAEAVRNGSAIDPTVEIQLQVTCSPEPDLKIPEEMRWKPT